MGKIVIPTTYKYYLNENKDENISSIAKIHGVTLDMVMMELERGVEAEKKYTESKQTALRNAIDNLRKDISYYSNMSKFDNEIKNLKK